MNLLKHFIPRAGVAVAIAFVASLALNATGILDLGVMETTVVVSFFVAAAMTFTLGRGLYAVLWVLLVDALSMIFQAILYMEAPLAHPLLRLGPALIAGLILALTYRGTNRRPGVIVWIWLACSLPAVASGFMNPGIEALATAAYILIGVIYPLVFYFAFSRASDSPEKVQLSAEVLAVAVLVLAVAPLLLIPFEFAARGQSSFALLQFGGRAYAIIGAMFLLWPVVINVLGRWPIGVRLAALAIVIALIATSFSRGAVLAAMLLMLATLIAGRRIRLSFLLGAGLVFVVGSVLAAIFVPSWLEDLTRFWLLRTNLTSNTAYTSALSFDAASFFTSGRDDIWRIGVTAFLERPLLGHGIGSTTVIMSQFTDGAAQYGGMHNLFLTIAAERGLLGLFAILCVLLRMAWLMWIVRDPPGGRMLYLLALGIYLLFCNTTGVELFDLASRRINATQSVLLFAYLGYLEALKAVNGSRFALRAPRTRGAPSALPWRRRPSEAAAPRP